MFGKKEGESCYMDTDCETGYVCMEGYSGNMECREPQPGVAKFGRNLIFIKANKRRSLNNVNVLYIFEPIEIVNHKKLQQ